MDIFGVIKRLKDSVGGVGAGLQQVARQGQGIVNMVSNVGQQPQPIQQKQYRPRNSWEQFSSPTTIPRVLGGIATQGASDAQGYTKDFLATALRANPVVEPIMPGAGGQYDPTTKQITLKAQDPYTVTHESLHADWDNKSPQEREYFTNLVENTITPQSASRIGRKLQNPLYSGSRGITELHSYAPEVQQEVSPQLSDYYNRYYSNGNFNPRSTIRKAIPIHSSLILSAMRKR